MTDKLKLAIGFVVLLLAWSIGSSLIEIWIRSLNLSLSQLIILLVAIGMIFVFIIYQAFK